MFAIARSDSDGGVANAVAAVVLAAVLIGTLYVGREVFVPIALAILLSFVLAPLVRVLERWRIPRPISVVGVVLLAFASIFVIGGMIAAQITQLAGDLPRYELTMREKIKSLRGAAATSGTLERAADVLQDLGKELDRPKDPSAERTNHKATPQYGLRFASSRPSSTRAVAKHLQFATG